MVKCFVRDIVLDSSPTLESRRNQEAYIMPAWKKWFTIYQHPLWKFWFLFQQYLLLCAGFSLDIFQRDIQVIYSSLHLSSYGTGNWSNNTPIHSTPTLFHLEEKAIFSLRKCRPTYYPSFRTTPLTPLLFSEDIVKWLSRFKALLALRSGR